MSSTAMSPEQWKQAHAQRLIACRWGCMISPEACRLYQSRTGRHVLHFNGDQEPLPRPNADYIHCLMPDPCPHVISEEEAAAVALTRSLHRETVKRDRGRLHERARRRNLLVNPDAMLGEGDWSRSLLRR
jgi:hypothetical protein